MDSVCNTNVNLISQEAVAVQPIEGQPGSSSSQRWFVGAADGKWTLQRTFGGLTVAQGLCAACKTVPRERRAHSLHAYFLQGGDAKRPIVYVVDRTRDGQTFSNRRVRACVGWVGAGYTPSCTTFPAVIRIPVWLQEAVRLVRHPLSPAE